MTSYCSPLNPDSSPLVRMPWVCEYCPVRKLARLGRHSALVTKPRSKRRPSSAMRSRFGVFRIVRSEEHTSELQSLMRISYAVFCLKKQQSNSLSLKPDVTWKLNAASEGAGA